VGFVLWAYAMARMDVGQVTTSLYLVPAAAIVISFVWLSQFPSPLELAGGAIALGGVVVANTRATANPPGPGRRPRHPVKGAYPDIANLR
jgi:drug/metabolite transporter (DMT)-like permease